MRVDLNKLANLSVIVAAISVSALSIEQLVRRFHSQAGASGASGSVEVGRKIKLQGTDFSSARTTVILGLSTTCPYCSNSLPFYRQLVRYQDASATKSDKIQIVALFPQPMPEVNRYMVSHNLGVSVVGSVDFSELGLSATPTVLLVNSKGEIEKVWVGMLSEQRQDDLRTELTSRCGHCL
jgi:hypothetical protein